MGTSQGSVAADLVISRYSPAGGARTARASLTFLLVCARPRGESATAFAPFPATLLPFAPTPAAAAASAALGLLPVTFRQGQRIVALPHELAAGTQLVTYVHVIMRATFALRWLSVHVGILRRFAARERQVRVVEAGAAHPAEAGQKGLAQDDVDPGVEGLVEAGQSHRHEAEYRGVILRGLQAEQDVCLQQPEKRRNYGCVSLRLSFVLFASLTHTHTSARALLNADDNITKKDRPMGRGSKTKKETASKLK